MAKIDYYLQIDRVVGECQVPRFLNWIPLLAYSFDDRQSVALGSGRSTGKVQIQTFHFTMEANRASPKLYLACAQGSPIKWAKLECVQSGLSFCRVTFQDVTVSDFQTGGMAGGELPVNSVCLQFSGLTQEYTKLLAQYSTPGWQMRRR